MRLLLILLLSFPGLLWAESRDSKSANEAAPPATQINTDPRLAEVDEILSYELPGLALHFINRYQPGLAATSLDQWLPWEHKRLELLISLENWQQVYDRIAQQKLIWQSLPLDSAISNRFFARQLEACLQLNQPERALSLLRAALWSGNADSAQVEEWRRLVIRGYLAMGNIPDAQIAMRRYGLDYGHDRLQTDDWILLRSQILIDAGHSAQAIKLLKNKKVFELEALLLLAQLEAGDMTADKIQKHASKQLKQYKKDKTRQSVYWYLILRAASLQHDYIDQVNALEKLLELKAEKHLRAIFSSAGRYVSADHLWSTYQQAGLQLSNELKLLRGDDESWTKKAKDLEKKKSLQARILFATLALNGFDEQSRFTALESLAGLLKKEKQGEDIIYLLFMKASQMANFKNIPESIRYSLVDYALARADLKTAASLMADLVQPPAGKDDFDWSLRRSRVLVLGGQYQEGADVLKRMLSTRKKLKEVQVDQYLQVVFDLQNVQAHKPALQAFDALEQFPLSKKVKRELDFWKAESHQAIDDHQQAAWLYLQSAQPIEGEIDPWYHTSIFKAAEALGKAGLIQDARKQFIKLLRITASESRKAVIQQRLQQLRLQQSHQLNQAAVE